MLLRARPLLLDVLTPAESRHLLCQVLGQERVNAESAVAATLSGLCTYLPLALRIAAAQLSGQPQRRLAEQVERLRGGERTRRY